jgi:hypothetical protein
MAQVQPRAVDNQRMLRRLFGRSGGQPSIDVTDEGVTRLLSDGSVEAVRWADLIEVRILITTDGPFAEDVFFVLDAGTHGCVVPQGHASNGFIARLQSLPGFDNERMIEAMSTVEDAEFVCWPPQAEPR